MPKNKTIFEDDSIMPYGKYKGRKMENIPAEYLILLYENDKCTPNVKKYIKDELETLELEVKQGIKKY